MLTHANVNVTAFPCGCIVRITSRALVDSVADVDTMSIQRRESGTTAWQEMKQIVITAATDFNFTLDDILALSGHTYDYRVQMLNGSTPVESELYENISFFCNGMFIGNFSQRFIGRADITVEARKNIAVEYVTTLSGKYPFRVSNSELNYATGTTSALFLPLDSSGKRLMRDDYLVATRKVLEFLCNGEDKILKLADGRGWYISIDNNPRIVSSNYWGASPIEFSWTEIGEFPNTGLAEG